MRGFFLVVDRVQGAFRPVTRVQNRTVWVSLEVRGEGTGGRARERAGPGAGVGAPRPAPEARASGLRLEGRRYRRRTTPTFLSATSRERSEPP